MGSLSAFSLLDSSLSLSIEKTSLGGTSSLQPPFFALGAVGRTGAGAACFVEPTDFDSFCFLNKHLHRFQSICVAISAEPVPTFVRNVKYKKAGVAVFCVRDHEGML